MYFQPGDRVVSIMGDFPGLRVGEYGTVLEVDDMMDPYVRWDEYNEHRHDGHGDIPTGHGWFVAKSYVQLAAPDDLGELPENEDIKFLFDT